MANNYRKHLSAAVTGLPEFCRKHGYEVDEADPVWNTHICLVMAMMEEISDLRTRVKLLEFESGEDIRRTFNEHG